MSRALGLGPPEQLRQAARLLSTEADRLADLGALLRIAGSTLTQGWAGGAADAAAWPLARLHDAVRAVEVESRRVATVVRAGGEQLDRARALTHARGSAGEPASLAGAADELADDAERVVAAGVIALVDRLQALNRVLVADVAPWPTTWPPSHGPAGLPIGMPPTLGSVPPAGQVADWLAALPPSQRRDMWRDAPSWLGSLDGLPATVRDRANRRLLRESRWQALAELRTAAQSGIRETIQGLVALSERLELLERVESQVTGHPDRLLLALDPARGHAVVSVGNPETARHVALLVPGMSTTVSADLDSLVATADALQRTASGLASGAVAVIAWLGYTSPQGLEAAFTKSARAGSTLLRGTLDGLAQRALAAGRDMHVTVIGHSYGSLVAGQTLGIAHHGVDDLVLLGSPGIGVDAADDVRLDDGEVYVAEADRDWIAMLGHFGADPGEEAFGATRLETDGTAALEGITGHSSYLDAGTESQHNIAAVVAGVPDEASLER